MPTRATAKAASVTGRIRSPRIGTARSAAATAYSGATNPVTVGPLRATATLTAAMKRERHRAPRARSAGAGSARVSAAARWPREDPDRGQRDHDGSASVQARPAIPSGVNERSAIAVAG